MRCCCSKCEDPDNDSECQCNPCKYRNGLIQLLAAQILMFLATLFSFFAMWDCRFVNVPANRVSDTLDNIEQMGDGNENLIPVEQMTRGLGFFIWEGTDGHCTPRDKYFGENMWELYRDFLGSDWDAPRAMATFTAIFAFCLMIWSFVFSCVAQPKVLRFALGITCIVLMPIFQAIPFMLLNSDFCKEYDCTLAESGRYAAGATSLYVLVGLAFLCTKPYPAHQQPVPEEKESQPKAKQDVVDGRPAEMTSQDVSITEESPESLPPIKGVVYDM